MDFGTYHIRRLVFFLHFLSVAAWFFYLYSKLWEFITAAVLLKNINVQTISFIIYSFLLVLLPAALIYSPKHSKKNLFMVISFALSAVILVGAVGDLITYNFFSDYTFVVGDAIFCNILIGIPNIYGTVCCLLLSLAYFFFGIYITENRLAACLLYLFIVLIGVIPAIIYSFNAWGGYPRRSWIEKMAFIAPHQASLLISFSLSSISLPLWEEHMG